MPNPRLAGRYAKSLLDIAQEQNSTDSVLADMQYLSSLMSQSKDFALVLNSPVIKSDKKLQIMEAVVGQNIQPLTKSFLRLLTTKGRETNLKEMAESYIAQYKVLRNIKTLIITTAVPATDDQLASILKNRMSNIFPAGTTIETKNVVNPDIIGGFIMEYDDKIVDASIRRDLNDVKLQFMKNDFVSTYG